MSITDIYVCCLTQITIDVFRDKASDDLTNPNLVIHVPKSYEASYFGNRTNLVYDNFYRKCYFMYSSIQVNRQEMIMYILLIIIVLT